MTPIEALEQRPMAGRVIPKNKRLPASKEGIGDRVSRIRRARGISQADLGSRIGVGQQIVSYYETGAVRIPAETLLKIGDVLHVSVYELLGRATTTRPAVDKRLWKVVERIQALPPQELRPLLLVIDGYLKSARSG